MNVTVKYFLVFASLLTVPMIGHAKEWRGIIPLHSTRADVERLLGPALKDSNDRVTRHETENEEIRVQYSTGEPCGTGWPGVWRIPAGTVVTISVYPKKEVRFSELRLDESQYRKTDNEGHGPPYFYYTNEEEGIQYEVTQGLVIAIIYLPASRDDNLRCPKKNGGSTSRSFINAKGWPAIVPLYSSRADVERLLGRPTGPLPTYYLSDVTVTFWYSSCRCGEKSDDDCWNVPVDTVVSIYVTLKGVNKLADLGLDLTRFKKTQRDDDVPGSFR